MQDLLEKKKFLIGDSSEMGPHEEEAEATSVPSLQHARFTSWKLKFNFWWHLLLYYANILKVIYLKQVL